MAGWREEYKGEERGTHWSVQTEVWGDTVQSRQSEDCSFGLIIGRGKSSLQWLTALLL